ncbi:uncharacterized protein [Malus domestica]|uniref:uncharacterized protein n=1 Tax=Malus domestica TaxID=3750 RepID=UPI0039754858
MNAIIDRGVLDCCQHWFCFSCIDNWATITNLCPLCQNEFQMITCVPVYDTIGSRKADEDSTYRWAGQWLCNLNIFFLAVAGCNLKSTTFWASRPNPEVSQKSRNTFGNPEFREMHIFGLVSGYKSPF